MQHAGISPLFSAQCSLNKLCAWRHNMPLPAVRCSPAAAIPYACGAKRALLPIAVGSMNINELMNINDIRESATIFPRPCKLTFDLLTLKVVSESGVTWATCVPILVFLRPLYSRVIPDVRDRQTDRQTDVRQYHRLMPPPRGGRNKSSRSDRYGQDQSSVRTPKTL